MKGMIDIITSKQIYKKNLSNHILATSVSWSASLLWLFLYDNMGTAHVRKLRGESPSWYHHILHPDKSLLLPTLTCCSVWNNGDPRGRYPQLKNGIQIFWSLPVVRTLNFAVIVAFCAVAGSAVWLETIQNMCYRYRLWSMGPYQMALWPYNNTGSIMP